MATYLPPRVASPDEAITQQWHLRFNEVKATQAAAFLLQLRGRRMSHLKLVKLIYLADREALLRWGRPITTDRYVSMDQGPVVSRIFGLISNEPAPDDRSFWHQHIATIGWDARLLSDAGNDELSLTEEELLTAVFSEHGQKSRWRLRDETQALPEWRDPDSGALPISYADIFRAGGKSEAESAELLDDLHALSLAESLFSPL